MVGAFDGFQKGLAYVGGQLGPLAQDNTMTAVLFDDRLQFIGHIIQGFIPADLAPLTGSALAIPDHRGLDPFVIVEHVDAGCTAGTQAAFHAGYMRDCPLSSEPGRLWPGP